MTIIVENLCVSLGNIPILTGVMTTFKPGKITALIGPNGAGKTTLLRAILGLLPSTGSILIDNTPVIRLSQRTRAQKFGYLPQRIMPHWNISVRELVGLGRLPHRGPLSAFGTPDEIAVTKALCATDIQHFENRLIDTLSGGECARVNLARVLAGEPEWVFADEPLANLDPPHQIAVMKLFRDAAKNGKSVIISLHDLNIAAQFADEVIALKSGTIVGEAITPEILEAAYGMAFDVIDRNGHTFVLPCI
jgi:iron complex transport system ATP-binding protein